MTRHADRYIVRNVEMGAGGRPAAHPDALDDFVFLKHLPGQGKAVALEQAGQEGVDIRRTTVERWRIDIVFVNIYQLEQAIEGHGISGIIKAGYV